MYTNDAIISLAIDEINNRSFWVTQQYLGVMEIEYQNDLPKISYVDISSEEDFAVVYFSIVNEPFFFAIWIKIQSPLLVSWVWIESCNEVYLDVRSNNLSFNELKSLTNLPSSEGWNMDDFRSNWKTRYNFSCIKFYASKNPGSFKDKIKELLDFLEKDSLGIKSLIEKAEVSIVWYIRMYIWNSMLGWPSLDKEIISRMSNLWLGIDYDLYVSGIPFGD